MSDLYAPVSGEVVAVNDALQDTPENVNNDPYGMGWILKIKMTDGPNWTLAGRRGLRHVRAIAVRKAP